MKDQRIAVVGAGAAGLTAAQELKKRGYQHTTVFEKEEAVGGKVSTYFLDGKPYELGAIWATTDYRTVHALSDELAVPRFAAQPLAMMTAQGKITDLLTFILKEYGFSSLARDSLHFWTLGLRHSRIKKPGFSGYPPDFFLSLDELARKYRFGALAYAMAPTMSACGYGYYEQAPALYWMKLMVLLFTFALRSGGLRGQLRSFDNGFQSLWQEVAKGLDVRTGSPVTSMKRSARGTAAAKIELTVNGGTHVFDKIIVTVPLETAHEFMDLSVMERTLFGKIRTLQYVVTVVDADSEAHVAFTRNIRPARLGHVNAALKVHKDTKVCVYYQITDAATTAEQALDTLRKDLLEIGVCIQKVHLQKVWSYFPHVVGQDLQDGYYDKLESMQGDRGTYYAGSLLSFETVEHTAAYAKDLVGRFF